MYRILILNMERGFFMSSMFQHVVANKKIKKAVLHNNTLYRTAFIYQIYLLGNLIYL